MREGHFDQHRTLALFEGVVRDTKQRGFPLIRFVTHMEWALENMPGVDDLLEYEARAAKLGIPPATLDSKIKSLKIDKYRFKTA